MVSLRSRIVEPPPAILKTSTADHSAHESKDDRPGSTDLPSTGRISEQSQLMIPVDTKVPSLLDVTLTNSMATKISQEASAADHGELKCPGVEKAEEGCENSNAASDVTDISPATLLSDTDENGGTANHENETNVAHQSVLQLGSSTEAASSSVKNTEDQPIRHQPNLVPSLASCSPPLKRKRTVDRTRTSRSLGMSSINFLTEHRTHS
jgi:hypothetical protein